MQDRVLHNPKIKMIWNSVVEEAVGEEKLSGVRIKNVVTGTDEVVDAAGLFYAIGK